jgi:hypothetical protein
MLRSLRILLALCFCLLLPAAVLAQMPIPPGSSSLSPPPPAPPPPPKIEVPVVPQLDSPPPSPKAQLAPRGSFGKRVTKCLDDGAAAGLNSAERAAYSRGCANQ